MGLVCFSVAYGEAGSSETLRSLTRSPQLPGGRSAVRERATTVAMHLIARVLRDDSD